MKNKNTIILIIPTLIIILIISIRVSYAYFAAEVTGSEDKTTITAEGGVMNINYDGGPKLTATDIVPSDKPFAIKTFTVTGNNNSEAPMYYKINLNVTTITFSSDAIKYKLVSTYTDNCGDVAPSDTILKDLKTGTSEIIIGIGNFTSPTNGNKVHTYDLELYFPSTNTNQIDDLGKTIDAHIEISGIKQPTLGEFILFQENSAEDIVAKGAPNFGTVAPTILTYKEITSTYTGSLSSSTNRAIGTGYTFNESTGNYTLTNYQINQTYGEEHIGQYTCNSTSYINCSIIYKIVKTNNNWMTSSIKYESEGKSYDYSDTGLYATEDEYGTSYYYRGSNKTLNNNLIWAGFQWKIVRINGDGSIRIIYNGTEEQFKSNKIVNSVGPDTSISKGQWVSGGGWDAKYVGYMYGGANGVESTIRHGNSSEAATFNETSSTIKTLLDNWYEKHILETKYSDDVVDNMFCNDRQLRSEVGGSVTGTGFGKSSTYYAPNYRLNTKKTPTLKCGLKNDRFTVSDSTKGNGNLTYPVGLLTADETSFAGMQTGMGINSNYLYTNTTYWLFSPSNMNTISFNYTISLSGVLGVTGGVTSNGYEIRPVLSLLPTIKVAGVGSSTNPFRIKD